jgi:hypothetical protein
LAVQVPLQQSPPALQAAPSFMQPPSPEKTPGETFASLAPPPTVASLPPSQLVGALPELPHPAEPLAMARTANAVVTQVARYFDVRMLGMRCIIQDASRAAAAPRFVYFRGERTGARAHRTSVVPTRGLTSVEGSGPQSPLEEPPPTEAAAVRPQEE